ncbi:DinB family protein, partial [Rhodothermus marinus]|uniref:DinB family protein n=1 Tax=Rhodothermus marinus TaxID=29549 RepID=UPI001FB2343F
RRFAGATAGRAPAAVCGAGRAHRALSEAELDAVRPVGRRRLPVRRATILHHLIEHAAHHSGQLILLVRLYARR